ncbi:MAG: 30S ribosomal protein S20 [Candidatus Dormibacteria bacterium]
MANSSSARKRIRSSARKHERNRRVRTSVRTAVAKARRAVDDVEEGSESAIRQAASALDKAAAHGVLHPRNVARRKSRLMRAQAAASVPQEGGVARTPVQRGSAQGTKPKSAGGSRKTAVAKAARSTTKTARTSSSQRRTAGGAGKGTKGS